MSLDFLKLMSLLMAAMVGLVIGYLTWHQGPEQGYRQEECYLDAHGGGSKFTIVVRNNKGKSHKLFFDRNGITFSGSSLYFAANYSDIAQFETKEVGDLYHQLSVEFVDGRKEQIGLITLSCGYMFAEFVETLPVDLNLVGLRTRKQISKDAMALRK